LLDGVNEAIAGRNAPAVDPDLEAQLMQVVGERMHPSCIGVGIRYEYVSITSHGCPPQLDRASINTSGH
jgi:hypothetical protein